MLFVADRVPVELRRIVEFLNGQMQPAEVLAVEIRQYEGQGLKTLVPVVIGQTQGALQKKGVVASPASKEKRIWDENSILEELATRKALGPEVVEAARQICDWAREHGDRTYLSTSPSWGGMGPIFGTGEGEFYPYLVHTDGTVGIYFQFMLRKPIVGDEAFRRRLLDKLNGLRGVSIPETSLSKRPGISLKILALEDNTKRFLEIIDWFVEEWRSKRLELGK
jgi:hypothetical protein